MLLYNAALLGRRIKRCTLSVRPSVYLSVYLSVPWLQFTGNRKSMKLSDFVKIRPWTWI